MILLLLTGTLACLAEVDPRFDPMPSNFPPDNWNMVVGVWGTDADRNESTNRTGPYSIELLSTAVATVMETGFFPLDAEFNGLYHVEALFTADSAAAGDDVTISLVQFDINKVQITSTSVHVGPVAVANTFEYATNTFALGSTVRFGKMKIEKTSNLFSVFLDRIKVDKVPRFLLATRVTSDQSIPDNTFTTIIYNSSFGAIVITLNTVTGVATVPVDGLYWISAQARFEALVDGQTLEMRILVNASATARGDGQRVIVGGAGDASVAVHKLLFLSANDTVEIQVKQSGAAAAKDILSDATGSEPTTFHISRLIGA